MSPSNFLYLITYLLNGRKVIAIANRRFQRRMAGTSHYHLGLSAMLINLRTSTLAIRFWNRLRGSEN